MKTENCLLIVCYGIRTLLLLFLLCDTEPTNSSNKQFESLPMMTRTMYDDDDNARSTTTTAATQNPRRLINRHEEEDPTSMVRQCDHRIIRIIMIMDLVRTQRHECKKKNKSYYKTIKRSRRIYRILEEEEKKEKDGNDDGSLLYRKGDDDHPNHEDHEYDYSLEIVCWTDTHGWHRGIPDATIGTMNGWKYE